MSTSDQVNLSTFQVLSTTLIEHASSNQPIFLFMNDERSCVVKCCVEVYKSFTCERRGKNISKFSELHDFIQEWKAYSSSSQSPTSFSSWSSTPTCAPWSGLESVNNSLNSSSCLAVPWFRPTPSVIQLFFILIFPLFYFYSLFQFYAFLSKLSLCFYDLSVI